MELITLLIYYTPKQIYKELKYETISRFRIRTTTK